MRDAPVQYVYRNINDFAKSYPIHYIGLSDYDLIYIHWQTFD